jgi:Tfp pilus assembly protein PilN
MAIALERLRGGGVDVPINLLPAEVRADQRMRRILNGALGAAGLILLILITLTIMQRMAVSNAKQDLATATAQATQLQTQVTALQPYGVMEQRLLSTRRTLAAALLGDVAWTKFMTDLSQAMPNDSWVTSVSLSAVPGASQDGSQTYGTATYAGNVTTFPGLAGWLQSMAKLKGLNFVYLSNGSKGAGGVVTFSANANITPSILSGRCQTETAPCP